MESSPQDNKQSDDDQSSEATIVKFKRNMTTENKRVKKQKLQKEEAKQIEAWDDNQPLNLTTEDRRRNVDNKRDTSVVNDSVSSNPDKHLSDNCKIKDRDTHDTPASDRLSDENLDLPNVSDSDTSDAHASEGFMIKKSVKFVKNRTRQFVNESDDVKANDSDMSDNPASDVSKPENRKGFDKSDHSDSSQTLDTDGQEDGSQSEGDKSGKKRKRASRKVAGMLSDAPSFKFTFNGEKTEVLVQHTDAKTQQKYYRCYVCEYVTNHKSHITTHMRIHTGERPYKCELCDYASKDKGAIGRHMLTHTQAKPFKCFICGYGFSQKSSLMTHMRLHTGEKPFKCEVCDYSSSVKGSLDRHMMRHTGEKPFKCSMCTYTFTMKSSLDAHIRIHTGEKPFKCEICGHACTQKSSLSSHMRVHYAKAPVIHKPFKCEHCDYATDLKRTLERHMLRHTGEKPFKCEVCGNSFSLQGSLARHRRIHTGEKPYKCDYCDFTCSLKSKLDRHLVKHARGFIEPTIDLSTQAGDQILIDRILATPHDIPIHPTDNLILPLDNQDVVPDDLAQPHVNPEELPDNQNVVPDNLGDGQLQSDGQDDETGEDNPTSDNS